MPDGLVAMPCQGAGTNPGRATVAPPSGACGAHWAQVVPGMARNETIRVFAPGLSRVIMSTPGYPAGGFTPCWK